jgi:UTP--glucose-1-phosphate uridylyltransferase
MKALIPAAGYGTRFLPASKTIPKEMLPVGAKPAIQLIVEEALAAGADEVVIVTSPDKPSLRRHFEADDVWRGRCAAKPEADAELAHLEEIGRRIRWAVQTEQRGLGHAVLQAADILRGEREPVLVLLGDALVSGEAPSTSMAAISRAHGGASVVGLEDVPPEKVGRYGIVKGERVEMPGVRGEVLRLSDLVEKPRVEEAPSRLAVAGRYLLDPAVFGLLATQRPGHGGEIQLTDSIRRLLPDRPVYGYRYPGRRHDIGNPAGYLETLQAFAASAARS